MRDIGKNIKLLRQEKNMTQDELAEALFVTRQTVSNYETGRSRPDVEMLTRIAEVLGVDANAVIYGPPVPESRKEEYRKTAICLGAMAVLGIGLLMLMTAVRKTNSIYLDQGWNMALISGWLIPAWKLLTGFGAMQLLRAVTGVNRLKKPAADYVRWAVLGLIIFYAVLILPLSAYMIRCNIEVALLRKAGGDFSYSNVFSFVPAWDQLAGAAMMGVVGYQQQAWRYLLQVIRSVLPFIAGALLWLSGKEKTVKEKVM